MRTQARFELRQAQRTLAAVYKAHSKKVPPSLLAAPGSSGRANTAPARQDTPSRSTRRAGSTDPSPGVSSGRSALAGVPPLTGPHAAGKRSSRSVVRGLKYPSLRTAPNHRNYRPVSTDLPYSLVTGEPTGAISVGYTNANDILADLMQHADYINTGNDRQHDLSPRLREAGYLPSLVSPLHSLPQRFNAVKATTVPAARPKATGTAVPKLSGRPPVQKHAGPSSLRVAGAPRRRMHIPDVEDTAAVTSDSDSEEGLVEPPVFYDRAALDKAISKELPDTVDLDDAQAVTYLLSRYETVCLRHRADVDLHCALLEAKLSQGKHTPYQEETRLWAVLHYSQTARLDSGDLEYATYKGILQQVAGGERLHFTRKTLSALTQKSSGSFDRYLADFETQSAYVQPSPSEKLEVFQAGLSNNLRQRVLTRSDGTEWTSWAEFLTVCKRFADAEYRSRELPVKALETVMQTSRGKRGSDNSSKSTATAKKSKPSTEKASSSAVTSPEYNHARTQLIAKWAKEQGLCYNCLQPRHKEQLRNKDGKTVCLRKRVKGSKKWGQTLDDAVKASLASAGPSQS